MTKVGTDQFFCGRFFLSMILHLLLHRPLVGTASYTHILPFEIEHPVFFNCIINLSLIWRVFGMISKWFLVSCEDNPKSRSSVWFVLFFPAIPLTAYGPMAAAAAAAVVRGKCLPCTRARVHVCVSVCVRKRKYSLCLWLPEVERVSYLDN